MTGRIIRTIASEVPLHSTPLHATPVASLSPLRRGPDAFHCARKLRSCAREHSLGQVQAALQLTRDCPGGEGNAGAMLTWRR